MAAARDAKSIHIYIGSAGMHALNLIDDLTAEAIERMKAEGFAPAVGSRPPRRISGLVNHGQVLEAEVSTRG